MLVKFTVFILVLSIDVAFNFSLASSQSIALELVLLSVSKNDDELYTYQYRIQNQSDNIINSLSVDVGLPVIGEIIPLLRDNGLPIGECGINAERSFRYNFSNELNTYIELIFESIQQLDNVIKEGSNSNQAMYKAILAPFLTSIKNQENEITRLLNEIQRLKSEYDNKIKKFDEYDDTQLKYLFESVNFVVAAHEEIKSVNPANLTINRMASYVESFFYKVKNLYVLSKSFYFTGWHQRLRIPVVISEPDLMVSTDDTFRCLFKNGNEAFWENQELKSTSELVVALKSYGIPGIRRYEIVGRNSLSNKNKTYTGLTVGPSIIIQVEDTNLLLGELLKLIHLSFREGWINSSSVANDLIVSINSLFHKSNIKKKNIKEEIEKLILYIENNKCIDQEKCHGKNIHNEFYSIFVPRLKYIERLN